MPITIHLTSLIQAHKSINHFNYSLAVDWAIAQLQEGNQTPSMLMLASFGEPIDRFEIKPYVTAVLNDLKLLELDGEEALKAIIKYHVSEILLNHAIRINLSKLHAIALEYDIEFGLNPFYLLYYAWDELDELGFNYYYDEATLDNIESIIKREAFNWLEKN